jgi:hypothetical protein
MKLADLAEQIGAAVLTPGRGLATRVDQVYAADRISELLDAAADNVLLVSNLPGSHLLRLAELMDVPGICLVNRQMPEAALIDAAREHGTLLMVSSAGLFETCGRLYQCLVEEKRPVR